MILVFVRWRFWQLWTGHTCRTSLLNGISMRKEGGMDHAGCTQDFLLALCSRTTPCDAQDTVMVPSQPQSACAWQAPNLVLSLWSRINQYTFSFFFFSDGAGDRIQILWMQGIYTLPLGHVPGSQLYWSCFVYLGVVTVGPLKTTKIFFLLGPHQWCSVLNWALP